MQFRKLITIAVIVSPDQFQTCYTIYTGSPFPSYISDKEEVTVGQFLSKKRYFVEQTPEWVPLW